MAYELKEENIDGFLASFRNDETRRDRLLDEIYIPSSVGRDNDTSDDLLALTQRKYILTHDDGLVNPLYAVKNLAVFALRHEMSDRLTFVENPLAMKDNPTLSEAREYIRQFDRVATDKYKGGVDGLEAEIRKEEALIAKMYEEGYKYDRVNSVNLFSAINTMLYGRRDRLRFYPIGKPQKQGKIFNSFEEAHKFYERIHTMASECKWHCPTAEAGEKLFSRINFLAEEFDPSGEWGISITEDGKTITLYDEDKAEMEDLLPYIGEGLKKADEKKEIKLEEISYEGEHIKGKGSLDGKEFSFDKNLVLDTLTLDGIDKAHYGQVSEKIAENQMARTLAVEIEDAKKKSNLYEIEAVVSEGDKLSMITRRADAVKVTGISRSVGHITGRGTVGEKPFRFDMNAALGTMTLDGIDEKYAAQIREQAEDMQKRQQENKKKSVGMARR